MKKRFVERPWFPFWADKWIFGSMRIECTLEERAIWIDLLAFASKDDGYIRANETTPYLIQQLVGMLLIPEDKLKPAIKKFIKLDKLEEPISGIYRIATWEKYQLSESYNRVQKHRKKKKGGKPLQCNENGVTISYHNKLKHNKLNESKVKGIKAKVIDYFNETTKQKRSYTCDETNKLINGRLKEGKTLKDFKHVIDTKTAQWLDDSKMRKFLRPSTLFRQGNFEDYLNEPYGDSKKEETQAMDERHEKAMEERK